MFYLNPKDIGKLFRVMHSANRMDHLAGLVAYFTGARISQVLNVRGEDIFELDGKYVIKIRPAKRGLSVTHNLHTDVDPAFDMSPLIAIAKIKGQSLIFGGLHTSNLNVRLKRYGLKAGIHSDYLHTHLWRHSAAMYVFDKTQRIGAVSQFLAHKSPSSAFIYLKENDGMRAQEAMDSLQLA